MKRTPLYEAHVKLGAKMVEFGGWEMPIQYSGIIQEHTATRTQAGLFDVSHMGEIELKGPEAEKALNYLTCNDVRKLVDGKAQYSAITNEQGGLVDDIIIYRFSATHYFICVNASNSDKDFAWFKAKNKFNCEFTNVSAEWGQIALQGPKALAIFEHLIGASFSTPYFHFTKMKLLGAECIVARTGYTGEDGVEIFVPAKKTSDLWQALLETGAKDGITPVGLGARDSLRLEACLSLYGHELGDDISPIESGLSWIVKLDKGDFIGRAIIEKHKTQGAPRSLIGFYVDSPGIVRQGDKILSLDGKEIGVTTSGTRTPTLNCALGLALVDSKFAKMDAKIQALVRDRKLDCHVAPTPFYKRLAK